MNCHSCRVLLPPGARACPNCGTLTPAYHAGSGALPDDPTTFTPLPPETDKLSGPGVSGKDETTLPGANARNIDESMQRKAGSQRADESPYFRPGSRSMDQSTLFRGVAEKYPGANPYASPPYNNPVPPPPPDVQHSQPLPPARPEHTAYSMHPVQPVPPYQPENTNSSPAPAAVQKKGPSRWRSLGVSLLIMLIVSSAGFGIRYLLPGVLPSLLQSSGGVGQNTTTASSLLSSAEAQALYNQTTSKTPAMNDTLTRPDNFGWDNYSTQNTTCSFVNTSFHSKAQPGFFSPCYAKGTNYSNFLLQAQIAFVSGHSGGIVFRADSQSDLSYQFRISTDGTCILKKLVKDSGGQVQTQILFSGSTATVVAGKPNLVAILAQDNHFYAFVNKKYVNSASDSTYQNGQVGVYVDSDANVVEAIFNAVQVWIIA